MRICYRSVLEKSICFQKKADAFLYVIGMKGQNAVRNT